MWPLTVKISSGYQSRLWTLHTFGDFKVLYVGPINRTDWRRRKRSHCMVRDFVWLLFIKLDQTSLLC